jgi:hypothetical protein
MCPRVCSQLAARLLTLCRSRLPAFGTEIELHASSPSTSARQLTSDGAEVHVLDEALIDFGILGP